MYGEDRMTTEKIIDALERCLSTKRGACLKCPIFLTPHCQAFLKRQTINLINQLTMENKNLKEIDIPMLIEECKRLKDD